MHIGGQPVGDLQDQRPGLEPASRLAAVADRDDDDPFSPQALERFVERSRNAFDHDDDRRSANGCGAARLIFDERSAGEREQGAQAPLLVFLICRNQRAERHFPPPFLRRRRRLL